PTRPAPRSTRLPTDSVDLATLLGTHGRPLGKGDREDGKVRSLPYNASPIPKPTGAPRCRGFATAPDARPRHRRHNLLPPLLMDPWSFPAPAIPPRRHPSRLGSQATLGL